MLKLRVERRAGFPVSFSLFLTDRDKNLDIPTKFTGTNIRFLEMCSLFVVLQPAYRRTGETLVLGALQGCERA